MICWFELCCVVLVLRCSGVVLHRAVVVLRRVVFRCSVACCVEVCYVVVVRMVVS